MVPGINTIPPPPSERFFECILILACQVQRNMKSNEREMLHMLACVHRSRLHARQKQEDVIRSFYSSNVSIPHPPPPDLSISRTCSRPHNTHDLHQTQSARAALSITRTMLNDTHKHPTRKHTYMVRNDVLNFIGGCTTRFEEAFFSLENHEKKCWLRSRASL